VALGCMAIRTQTELMMRRVQFMRRTKKLQPRQRALDMPEDIIQNIGIHGSLFMVK